jgi:hypothetical protein
MQWTIRYVGPSLKGAIEKGRNTASTEQLQVLASAVKIDPNNGTRGMVDFEEVMVGTPGRTYSRGGTQFSFVVERPDGGSNAWELTAESREKLKEIVGLR